MRVNNELERMWKEAVAVQFEMDWTDCFTTHPAQQATQFGTEEDSEELSEENVQASRSLIT
jgi:hypothetical protein